MMDDLHDIGATGIVITEIANTRLTMGELQ